MGSPAQIMASSRACSGSGSITGSELSLSLLLSSPRRRGPIVTKFSVITGPATSPCHIALLRRMGPRLRGDDNWKRLAYVRLHHSLTINHFVSKRSANSLLLQHVA